MSKPTKINFSKKSMQCIGKLALAQETVISKNQFLNYSTESQLNKFISQGYIERAQNDYLHTTSKFNTEFRKQFGEINKDYSHASFSGSKSINHSSGIQKVMESIPKSYLLNDDVKITSGKDLTDEYNRLCKTQDYKTEVNNYVEEQKNLIQEYQTELNYYYQMENKEMVDFANQRELEDKLNHSQQIVDIYNNEKDFCSPPDCKLTMSIECFQSQIDYFKEQLQNEDLTIKETNSLNYTIEQMEQLYEQTIERNETVITYCVESITDNYRSLDLCLKENMEVITHIETIYIKV